MSMAELQIGAGDRLNWRDRRLTVQGIQIVNAIDRGISRMTRERWNEITEAEAQSEDGDEWFAPEFADARKATEGIEWDFDGWHNALDYIINGSGKLGGVSMLESSEKRND